MKRLFYLSLGIAAGAYATYRLSRTAEAWTPAGLAGTAAAVFASVREIADDARARAEEREGELRDMVGLDEMPRPYREEPPQVQRS